MPALPALDPDAAPDGAPPKPKIGTAKRKGQTGIRFRVLERIEEWEDVRRLLGYDLPVLPIVDRYQQCQHPDPAEWRANQQAALARGGPYAQQVASFFSRGALAPPTDEEPPVATDDFNPILPLGQFCAEIEAKLPRNEKPLVVMFYQRLTKAGLRVATKEQFQEHWETHIAAARA